MTKGKYDEWLNEFEHTHGEIPKIEGERYYYWASWHDLKELQKKEGFDGYDDVRTAGGLLERLGYKNTRSFVEEVPKMNDESEEQEYGWHVYWA